MTRRRCGSHALPFRREGSSRGAHVKWAHHPGTSTSSRTIGSCGALVGFGTVLEKALLEQSRRFVAKETRCGVRGTARDRCCLGRRSHDLGWLRFYGLLCCGTDDRLASRSGKSGGVERVGDICSLLVLRQWKRLVFNLWLRVHGSHDGLLDVGHDYSQTVSGLCRVSL